MFSVYILKPEKNNSYYIGSSRNTIKRIEAHNQGLSKSTKRYLPWKLVYEEKYDTLIGARRREKQIKSWKKRSEIKKLLVNFKI